MHKEANENPTNKVIKISGEARGSERERRQAVVSDRAVVILANMLRALKSN